MERKITKLFVHGKGVFLNLFSLYQSVKMFSLTIAFGTMLYLSVKLYYIIKLRIKVDNRHFIQSFLSQINYSKFNLIKTNILNSIELESNG